MLLLHLFHLLSKNLNMNRNFQDNSGTIEKHELRSLFVDMFPSFPGNMLERYVNDEFKAVDKDFSNSKN